MSDPYSTHQACLLKAVALTTGPVLELGMGEGSTPLLHELCEKQDRVLLSCDTDIKWLRKYEAHFTTRLHSFHHVERHEWDQADIEQPWSVVLIDHRPARRRRHEALRLANLAEYIVCHDTEPEIDRFYRFSRIFDQFKQVFHDNRIPRTSVLSNLRDLRGWENDEQLV